MRFNRSAVLALLATAAICRASSAQAIPFSQRGLVSQTVGFTEITIAYGRPVARGRALFGSLVKWDTIWHPGADSASRLTITHDIDLEGHPLPAGEYTLWLIPRERTPWTVIVSGAAHVFHTPYPGSDKDVLRFEVPVEQGAQMETLAYYFPLVNRDEAILRIHWGTTIVPLRIRAPWVPGSYY